MQVIQIEEIDKKRVQILLENGCSFPLYKGERRQYDLQEGKDLSQEVFQEIQKEILIKRVRRRTMHLLEKMDRTESQLRAKLRQGYYPEDVIEDAINYVKGYHYLDDLRYARNFVRCHKDRKSRRIIQMQLIEKGVSREQIQQAIEEEYEQENEQEQILKWVQKKNYSSETADLKEKQKMYRFLMRKGFSSNDILHVLDYLT